MSDVENIELFNVDEDIRAAFSVYGTGGYKIGVPTQIQLVRLLRTLIDVIEKSNNDPGNSRNS